MISRLSMQGERTRLFFMFTAFCILTTAVVLPFALRILSTTPPSAVPGTPFSTINADAVEYSRLADNLLAHGSFSSSPSQPLIPNTFRTPVYPVVLAGVKLATGSYDCMLFLQIILTAVSALFIYILASRLTAPAVGAGAAIVFILNPNTITHTILFLTENLFTVMLLGAVLILTSPQRKPVLTSAVLGTLCGILTLIRPIATFLPIVFILIHAWNAHRAGTPAKKIVIASFVMAACAVVILVPWMYRNQRVSGAFAVSSVGTYNIFRYNVPHYLAVATGRNVGEIRKEMEVDLGNLGPEAPKDLQNTRIVAATARRYLDGRYAGYASFHLAKTMTFFVTGSTGYFLERIAGINIGNTSLNLSSEILSGDWDTASHILRTRSYLILEYVFWALILLLALWSFTTKDTRHVSAALWAIILYFAVLTGPVAYARYRLPVEPLLLILAGVSLVSLKRRVAPLLSSESRDPVSQFIRYLFVGGLAFVVDFSVLILLTEVAGLHYLISGAIAFALGLTVNYSISVRWVFHSSRVSSKTAEFAMVAGISGIGLALNELLLWAGTEYGSLHYLLSKILATMVVLFWNFGARKLWVFR